MERALDTETEMDRLWFASYPKDVPHTVDPDAYSSLTDMLLKTCEMEAKKKAFYCLGSSLTYGQVDEASLRVAAYLQQQCGVGVGDRVAIMLPNLLQYPVVMLAVLRIGAVVVNVNPRYTQREVEAILDDSGAVCMVLLKPFLGVLHGLGDHLALKHVLFSEVGDFLPWPKRVLLNKLSQYRLKAYYGKPPHHFNAMPLRKVVRQSAQVDCTPVHMAGDDLAFLQYTGGTTGKPKGVMLTHRNMVANVLQGNAWMTPVCAFGEDRFLTSLPLYHIFSLTICCLCAWQAGSACVLVPDPRNKRQLMKALKNLRCSVFVGLNTLFQLLLRDRRFQKGRWDFIRITISGGMKWQRDVAEQWRATTLSYMVEGYGLTESSPMISIVPPDTTAFRDNVGLPLPSTDVQVRDPEGRVLAQGETGVLWVRGPQVMRGYWRRPEATFKALDSAGWLNTEDIAFLDEDGFVHLVDRQKDMVIISGFNVYPSEVEAVLAEHPHVVEAAVIGVHSEKTGEALQAFVVCNGSTVDEAELIAFCRERLTGYKVPKRITFMKALPKSIIGKVLRRALRDQAG